MKKPHKISKGRRRLVWSNERGDFSITVEASMIDLLQDEQRYLLDDAASRIMLAVGDMKYQAGPFLSRIMVTE